MKGALLPSALVWLLAVSSFAAGQEPPAPRDLVVTRVEITGMEEITPPVPLPRRLPLRPGVPYTAERLEATEAALMAGLAESGRPYAEIEISAQIDAAEGTAAIRLDVSPGPRVLFGEVTLRAPPPLQAEQLLEGVAYAAGDLFRPALIERTRARLEALPAVEAVAVQPMGLEVRDTVIPTIIQVSRPARLHGIGVRGSLSSVECLELAASWSHSHFLGAPRLFAVTGGFANLLAAFFENEFPCTSAGEGPFAQPNYFTSVELLQPWVGDPRLAVRVRGFYRRETAPQAFLVHGFGAELAAIRELGRGLDVFAAYSPERSALRAVDHYFCAVHGACTREELAELTGPSWLAPARVALRWSPPVLDPLTPAGAAAQGLWPGLLGPAWRPWARLGLTGAAGVTGSEFRFLRGVVEGAVTRTTGRRTELAARVRTGALGRGGRLVPPQVRFFSGGLNTVRGIPQNLLGPLVLVAGRAAAEAMGCEPEPGGCPDDLRPSPDQVSVRPTGGLAVLEANLEARLRLARTLQLAAFTDAGLVRGRRGRLIELVDPGWAGAVTPGLGIRWWTRLGPIRVDVGYDPRDPQRAPLLLDDRADEGLVPLGTVWWAPHTHDEPERGREIWRRLQLHLALGQPF